MEVDRSNMAMADEDGVPDVGAMMDDATVDDRPHDLELARQYEEFTARRSNELLIESNNLEVFMSRLAATEPYASGMPIEDVRIDELYAQHAPHHPLPRHNVFEERFWMDHLLDGRARYHFREIQTYNERDDSVTFTFASQTGLHAFRTRRIYLRSMVIYSWTMELQESGIWQIGGEFYATLLLVGTLMLIFHSIFEWLYWRETQCVMPYWNRARKVPWDPVVHGIPHRFRWLGLPSMWFTSSESYADLSLWIHHAKGHEFGRKANKVFPEEMALFSLYARNACQLRRSLRHAKLYNVHKASFLTRGDDAKSKCQRLQSLPTGSEPEELQIDFMFYDILSKEYLQPEEDYTDTQIHVLQHAPPTWPEGDRGATLLQQYQWKLHQASI
eukprot:symbB.v1.2.029834.t1/scaffold3307.1/size59352/1